MILVTGATGMVGSEVVRQLSARGASARVVVRDLRKAADLSLPHVEVVEGNFDQPETMGFACAAVKPGVQEALGRAPRGFEEFARDYAPMFAGGAKGA